ncbi:DUF305 domain-containing protein [Trujillonella humicola]|uniref:DUF305 domain-containing protein n=1 Tax=Trujillonella humicola TaxID=3383699 RepID=UPI003905924E
MTAVLDRPAAATPAPPARQPLRVALLAVIAAGLVALGGGLAVALGIGADAAPAAPAADSVDAGFSRDMTVHHLQAVQMANLALERSTDPEVRQLAFDISAGQTNQAGRMQGWLALWGLPLTGPEHMTWMAGDDMAGHHTGGTDGAGGALMPGMASREELAQLRGLTGTEFDVEFLRMMIRHHQGGAEMARYAAEHADRSAVRVLAGSIADAQAAETTTMTSMLTARGGTPLPPP